jgi:hypothetical protein
MRPPPLRSLASVAAVTLTGLAVAAACGGGPVSPLPGQRTTSASTSMTPGASSSVALSSASPVTAPSATPASRRRAPTTSPTRWPTPGATEILTPTAPTPSESSTCQGAVSYTVDASEDGPAWPAPCLGVGAIVRMENLGPGDMDEDPADAVSCSYAAGVHECRLLRPGTVQFTMTREEQTRSLTVVIK